MTETPYERLERELIHRGSGRPMTSRKVNHNTYANRVDDQTIAVRLHATDVVLAHADGTVTLHDGGWLTVTTKARMNDQTRPANVWSERGVWFVSSGRWGRDTSASSYIHRYFDGMRFDPETGRLVNPTDEPDHAATDQRNKATTKAIRGYVNGLTVDVLTGLSETGNGGDCLYCLMRTTDTSEPIGDAFNDHDHLRGHIDEGYYMVSLIVNAYRDRGYGDPELVASMDVQGAIGGRDYATKNLRQTISRRQSLSTQTVDGIGSGVLGPSVDVIALRPGITSGLSFMTSRTTTETATTPTRIAPNGPRGGSWCGDTVASGSGLRRRVDSRARGPPDSHFAHELRTTTKPRRVVEKTTQSATVRVGQAPRRVVTSPLYVMLAGRTCVRSGRIGPGLARALNMDPASHSAHTELDALVQHVTGHDDFDSWEADQGILR